MIAFRAAGALAAAVLVALSSPASAQSAARGKKLAQERCARCHLVEHPSRREQATSPNPSAPPFLVIALAYKPSDLEEAFAEGIVVGHDDASRDPAMPEITLDPRQARDLVAHLESLLKEPLPRIRP